MIIRRKVLNMTLKMWEALDKKYGINCIEFDTTPHDFLIDIGLPGALSACLNDEERKFFDEIYKLERLN